MQMRLRQANGFSQCHRRGGRAVFLRGGKLPDDFHVRQLPEAFFRKIVQCQAFDCEKEGNLLLQQMLGRNPFEIRKKI